MPYENEMAFSEQTGPTNRSGSYQFLVFFPNSLIRVKNRFVKNGTANFFRNIKAEISGPPPEVIPANIPVTESRNEPSTCIPTEISGTVVKMESTQGIQRAHHFTGSAYPASPALVILVQQSKLRRGASQVNKSIQELITR